MFLRVQHMKNPTKCRVELHNHFDSAVRFETGWELYKKRGVPMPGDGSLQDFKDSILCKESKGLLHFLAGKGRFMPSFINNLEAIERIAYEMVEDLSRAGVAYCETRFSPFAITHQKGGPVLDFLEATQHLIDDSDPPSADEGVLAVLRGLERGERKFCTKVRVILCCIRGRPEWSWDVLRMCDEYRDKGVVGIDISGNEAILEQTLAKATNKAEYEELLAKDVDVQVFTEAKKRGIHRTVHTGESAAYHMVQAALDHFHAERLGHGYRGVAVDSIYSQCQQRGVHFEICPYSSLLTGALDSCTQHPLHRLIRDGASWSFSTDDPILTGTSMEGEAGLLRRMGLNEANLASAAFQGALHSFLPKEEKQELLSQLHSAFGVVM